MKLPKELRDKSELTGKVKRKDCSVKGCSENAIRSLSENAWKKYVETGGLKIKDNPHRKIYLCKSHYSQANKFKKSLEKNFQKKGFLNNSRSIKKGNWEI